jgi:CRISPR-associated endoribonuclease Cas6
VVESVKLLSWIDRRNAIHITVAQLDFTLKALEPLILPPYKGSTLRGGFGAAFRRIVCVIRDKECSDCLLKGKCVYSYIFETPPPADTTVMRKYEAAPHPFVIEPPFERKRVYRPGEDLLFGLVLIGRAIDYLPYFIYTFDELGKTGIGKGRGEFELSSVASEGKTVYDATRKTLSRVNALELPLDGKVGHGRKKTRLTLSFLTPTRISYSGSLTLDIEFHMIIRNLLRRISLLSYFHGSSSSLPPFDFKGTIEKAKAVDTVDKSLRWYDWERYSSRQEQRINMGGFVGEITFEGNFAPFVPLVKAGEVLHVGKGTAFGLGRYEVRRTRG